MLKKILATFVFVAVIAGQASATALSDKTTSMQPGTWAELATNGFTDAMLRINAGFIFQFAEGAVWDSISRQVLFIGGAHTTIPNEKFITYSEATNEWTQQPSLGWFCGSDGCVHHAYDQNAINPAKGDFYHFTYGSSMTQKLHIATGAWTRLPDSPANGSCCRGLAYFPEMGGLVLVGGGYVDFWNESTNAWSRFSPTAPYLPAYPDYFPMGDYQNFAEYNPVHKVVLFGGGNGNTDIYKLDGAGQITKLNNAAVGLGLTPARVTVDPVSGEYLVLNHDNSYYYSIFHAYDVIADTWKVLGTPLTSGHSANSAGVIAVPISTYGVTMFLANSPSRVFLYKHSPSAGLSGKTRRPAGNLMVHAWPNPFNSVTKLMFAGFPGIEKGALKIYDLSGKLVRDLSPKLTAGQAELDGRALAQGVYLARLSVQGETYDYRLVLMR